MEGVWVLNSLYLLWPLTTAYPSPVTLDRTLALTLTLTLTLSLVPRVGVQVWWRRQVLPARPSQTLTRPRPQTL